MSNNFCHLFYIRKGRNNEEEVSIYLRVTKDGNRAEVIVHRKISRHLWNAPAGRASGSTLEAQRINRYLNTVENKVFLRLEIRKKTIF